MGVDGARLLFVELAKADTSGDYEKAVKIANKILRQYPKETSAFKCKTVALIQLGHFAEALALMKKTPSHQMGECGFEKAYAQYRLNDDNAALETLSKLDASDVRCMELKAQVLYRKGSYEEALLLLR
ncbi:hypothetical protein AB6A40_009773 [Gnathostoma spinigerum]|uniref:Uncharacterized protein n=1 Tax=Gnathostoma spinigerum TaxID=75299 RepID=A0ABD6EY34_9BILA